MALRPRTIFFGTGAFGIPVLRALAASEEAGLVGVVTGPMRASGRGLATRHSPIAEAAAALAATRDPGSPLAILAPDRLRVPESIAAVLELEPALAVLADYGQIVPGPLLELPLGALNLHPSLLPRHRGATPIPATILAGDDRTGVSLFRMDAGLDSGPIVGQSIVDLAGDERAPDLEHRLAELAAGLLADTLGPWIRGEITARPQPDEGVTLTRRFARSDGRLDPNRPASELERSVRALQPWPGTYVEAPGIDSGGVEPPARLGVLQAAVRPSLAGDRPGSLVPDGDGLALATTDGRLVLVEVLPAGGRAMSGAAYRRGRPGLLLASGPATAAT